MLETDTKEALYKALFETPLTRKISTKMLTNIKVRKIPILALSYTFWKVLNSGPSIKDVGKFGQLLTPPPLCRQCFDTMRWQIWSIFDP